MSINLSFDIGQKALRANQLGLTVTGQNIANVNNSSYSRQEVILTSVASSSKLSTSPGGGVDVISIQAAKNQFIDSRLRSETSTTGRLSAQQQALIPLEATFNDTSTGGINSALNTFFSSFRNLDINPASTSLRINVVESANALATAFNSTRNRLTDIQNQTDKLLQADVSNVNSLLDKIAKLNVEIGGTESVNANNNELIDQRSDLLNQLSEYIDINITKNEDSSLTVSLSDGRALVLNDKVFQLETTSTPPNGLTNITLNGQAATIKNGRIKGLLDGIGQIGTKISDLDNLANTISSRVNALHQNAVDLDGNTGTSFFVSSDGNAISAANLSISSSIKGNPRLLAAAEASKSSGDGTNARQIANLLTDNNSQVGSRTGSFSSIYSSFVAEVGQALKSTEDLLSTQQAILAQTNEQRNAFSGVSLDEETINLLRYQRAFEAAARFLKVSDEITRTIIALGD